MTPPVDLLVHRLVAAFPGRAIIAILPQTTAPDLLSGSMTPPEEPPPASLAASLSLASDDGALTPPDSASHAPRSKGKRTPAVRAQEILHREGDVSLSREEWARRLGSGSGRLIDRVIRHRAAPTTNKGSGKDHRVRLVRASDLVTVLETIEGVKAGRMAPPDWYDDVARAA